MTDQPNLITHHPSLITYFPGCALKDQAKDYEKATLAALAKLGYEVKELPRWNCCGTVYSLAQDDLMRHVGPVRNFIRAQELGETRLLTLCAMCYNTLSRSALFVQNQENLRRINAFMDDEEDYRGGVRVMHLSQFLLGEIGEEKLSQAVVQPLLVFGLGPTTVALSFGPRKWPWIIRIGRRFWSGLSLPWERSPWSFRSGLSVAGPTLR